MQPRKLKKNVGELWQEKFMWETRYTKLKRYIEKYWKQSVYLGVGANHYVFNSVVNFFTETKKVHFFHFFLSFILESYLSVNK